MKLASREKQLPGGYRFFDPRTKFRAQPYQSFDSIVRSVHANRVANRALTERFGLSTDFTEIANEVDAYNAKIAMDHGWRQFVVLEGDSYIPPEKKGGALLHLRNGLNAVAEVSRGAKTIVTWIRAKAEAVPAHQAEARANVCSICPQNKGGNWTDIFTVPVANEIRKQLQRKKDMQLQTSKDGELYTCKACMCPIPLKVWLPLSYIAPKLSTTARAKLDETCWILAEERRQ